MLDPLLKPQGIRKLTAPSTVSHALALSGLVPFEAKILLAHVLGRDRAWIAAHGDAPLSRDEANAFETLARRRRDGEPVAYLPGRREVFGHDLEITPDVLIPRPETELLVERALSWLASDTSASVLDLGCGSGAVALAIARERPRSRVLGVDRAHAAVELAKSNAQRLAIANASFIVADWFEGVPREAFDVIVANPPYVAEDDAYLKEGDLRFEPPFALTPGPMRSRRFARSSQRRPRISLRAPRLRWSTGTTSRMWFKDSFRKPASRTCAHGAISPESFA